MLHLSGSATDSDISIAVRNLLEEDAFYDRTENRSSHREHLVRPVHILVRGNEGSIVGFSRNVSDSGIGLITAEPVETGTMAILEVETLKSEPVKFLAECRWCRNYGRGWKISGWHFVNMHG
ncbi:PilZ domain protein [Stieleria bergensis]|uniref:PilZ domain protein n=1 Tax=Stieleria bergensis TaxID=2528025 RepID=A0A517SSH3_9BACT|nr:PilZ domain protein [Planctomycetes bacterium SV_7m_r]